MKIIAVTAIFAAITIIGFLFFIYLGIYNVSALAPHRGITRWALNTTMDNSVRRHAAGIEVPNLAAAETIRTGAMIYEKSCVLCHGAAGIDRSDIGNGLNPLPPKLEKAAPDWTPAELFWIAKNGIKMSGMPAFGRSLSDSQLWAVIALLKQLPELTPEQYRALNGRRK